MSSTCYIDWSIEHHLTSHAFIIKSYSSCSFRLAYLGNLGESSLRYFPSIVWLNAILLCWKWLSLDISLCSRNKGNPSWAALILDYIASRTDKRCLRRCCSTFVSDFMRSEQNNDEPWGRRMNGWMKSRHRKHIESETFRFSHGKLRLSPDEIFSHPPTWLSRAAATQLEKALTRPPIYVSLIAVNNMNSFKLQSASRCRCARDGGASGGEASTQ